MTTQQVAALFVICAFVIGLFAYAYFLGRKAGRTHRQTGLLFESLAGTDQCVSIMGLSPQISIPEGSGPELVQTVKDAIHASLRETPSIDEQKTKSLCCAAAGIIQPISSPAESLTPHDKLREAAPADTTLIAKNRPHAQPAEGYTHSGAAFERIADAVNSTLSKDGGAYTTTQNMALAIYEALDQSGMLQAPQIAGDTQQLRDERDELAVQLEAEQRKHHLAVANLKRMNSELEARIMSYTGLAVTRTDYDQLLATAETLRLANRTLTALKSEPQAARAGHQAEALDNLAKRIHAQLRATPASASKAEVAA